MPPSGLRLLCLIQTGKFGPLCRDSRLWALLDILPSLGIEPRVGKSHCRKEWRTNTGCVEHLCKSFTVHLNHTAPSFCLQKCGGGGDTRCPACHCAFDKSLPLTCLADSKIWDHHFCPHMCPRGLGLLPTQGRYMPTCGNVCFFSVLDLMENNDFSASKPSSALSQPVSLPVL